MSADTKESPRVSYISAHQRKPDLNRANLEIRRGDQEGREKAKLGNLEAAFTDPVTIKFRGKEITVPALEALCWQSVREGLAKADGKATWEALKLANQLGLFEKARRERVEPTNEVTRFTLEIFDEPCLTRVREARLREMSASDGLEDASPDLTQICAQKDDSNSL